MRLLVWSEAEAFGGHECMAVELINGLNKDFGVEVRWRIHPGNKRLRAAIDPHQPVVDLPRPSWPDRIWRGFVGELRVAFRAAVAAEQPDVVMAIPGWPTGSATPAFAGGSVPLVVYVPNGPRGGGVVSILKRRASSLVLNQAQLVVTCAEAVAGHLRRCTTSPVMVVENFVDAPVPMVPILRERPAIGLVGRVDLPVKGHAVLVEALRLDSALLSLVDVLVIGTGPDELRLQTMIARSGLADRVVSLGWLPPIDAYARLDAVAMPSFLEGAPLVAIEACQRSLPVIGSALPELDPYTKPELRFPVGSAFGLASAIRRWLVCRRDPQFCGWLEAQAQVVRQRHDRRRAISTLHRHLATLTTGRTGTPFI